MRRVIILSILFSIVISLSNLDAVIIDEENWQEIQECKEPLFDGFYDCNPETEIGYGRSYEIYDDAESLKNCVDFDFGNSYHRSHQEKFALGKEGTDISLGVCKCVLSNGSAYEKCREQCPLEKNGKPVDFVSLENNDTRRYYNPITTEGRFSCNRFGQCKQVYDPDAFCYDLIEAAYKRVSNFSPIPALFFDNQRYCIGKIFSDSTRTSMSDPIGWGVFEGVWDYGRYGYSIRGDRDGSGSTYYLVRRVLLGGDIEERIYRVEGDNLEEVANKWELDVGSYFSIGGMVASLFGVVGCSNAGINDIEDVWGDVNNVCGVGRYPSFDYQCAGNIGCKEVNRGMCGCRCTRCDSDKCVEMSCDGECVRDVGFDVNDVLDYEDISDEDIRTDIEEVVEDAGVEEVIDVGIRDAEDGGVRDEIEYECKDLGDPVGVEFSGNLDEPIVYIGEVYMDGWITGDYVVWVEPGPSGWGKEVKYLSLKDRRVRRAPNCDGYDAIRQMVVYDDKVVWNNHIDYITKGNRQDVLFYYNLVDKKIKIISPLDEAYHPKIYEDDVVYLQWKEKKKLVRYDLINEKEEVLSSSEPYISILDAYRTALYKNLIVGVSDRIFTINIDTLEEKTHYKGDPDIGASPLRNPLPRMIFFQYVDKNVHGHYTNDIYLINIETDEVTRVTDDEAFQFAAVLYGDIVAYHENDDPKASDVSYGYLVVYDLKTKVKRKVKELSGIVSCRSFDGRRLLYTPDIWTGGKRYYLVDLEKLGVVKDGHVVPE